MSGKSDVLEFEILQGIFCGKPVTNLFATAGTTLIWAALATADPTDAGSTANEGGYGAYTRVAVQRSTGGFTVTSGATNPASVSPNASIDFPQNVAATTGTFGYFMCFPSSAATSTACLYVGTVSPTINFSNGVTPRITTGSSITED